MNHKSGTIFNSPQKQSVFHKDCLMNFLFNNGYAYQIIPLVALTDYEGTWKG